MTAAVVLAVTVLAAFASGFCFALWVAAEVDE